MTEQIVRYNYRLRPGAVAERALIAEWHRCRYLWNEAVHQQKMGRNPSLRNLGKLLTEARSKFAWLRAGSQDAQGRVLRSYATALSQSFTIKGRGRPTYKERHKNQTSLQYSVNGFSLRDGRLKLPKGVIIPVVWSRELPSPPTSVSVYQDSIGHWYASFIVRREGELTPEVDGAIGIDWGVSTTATTTDPRFDLPFGGHRRRCAAELARVQRKMARRRRPRGQVPSNGYRAARITTAKLHKKAQRQNTHSARIWASDVVAHHQMIAIEDLRSKFLAKSKMARKAADAAIGTTKRELIERGTRAGREVVLVPPAYTTMTCGSCFARNKHRLTLVERIFRCDSCGHIADRDRNAARVILATVERDRAGVDDVSRSLVALRGSVGTRSDPGILRPLGAQEPLSACDL